MNVGRQRLYLTDILERIRRVEVVTEGGRDAFLESFIVQDVVVRAYEVIGEIVKRLEPELTGKHPDIPWRQIAGFRDVLIHDYDRIDLAVVWRIVEEDTPVLKAAVEAMLAELGEEAGDGA